MAPLPGTPPADSHGDCQLPLGYDGVVRIRAAPHLVLRPEPRAQPTLLSLDAWQVVVGGSCENLVGPVPCRLEWRVRSDCFDEKRVPHRRETCLVPDGKRFLVREKEAGGTRPLHVSAYELGLLGTGRLGFRLEPLLFGNAPVEVTPEDAAAIAFDLPVRLDFTLASSELTSGWVPDFIEQHLRGPQVGTVMRLEPDFSPLFQGHLATLDLSPRPVEGTAPDESATVRIEWEVGHPEAHQALLWRVGYRAVRGAKDEVLDNRLVALGGMESSPALPFQYRLSLSRKPAAAPPARKGDTKPPPPPPTERLHADPRPALTVPRPRLTEFAVALEGGRLGVRGRFEHFSDSVTLDLTLKPYVRVPQGEGWRVEELDDFVRNLLASTRVQASLPMRYTQQQAAAVNLCLPDDISTKLAALETVAVAVHHGAFERELLDLKQLPRHYVEVLRQARGLQVFAALRPTPVPGTRELPFWAVADYEASEPGGTRGFAPFEAGAFVSRVFATGVCTVNTVDLSGTMARLTSPMPAVPPELQEEFSLFVGTVCGEAIGQSEAAWKGVAHTIMNRVARGYEHWRECLTPTEVIQRTGFNGSTHPHCAMARAYLKSPTSAPHEYRDRLARLISAVTPIYMRMAGDGGDVVFFYSPQAQKALHQQAPGTYRHETPGFVHQQGAKELVDITSRVLGDAKDDFRFFAFKHPEKHPRPTAAELAGARGR